MNNIHKQNNIKKNFFDFDFKNLKVFLTENLKIEDRKLSMRSKFGNQFIKKELAKLMT